MPEGLSYSLGSKVFLLFCFVFLNFWDPEMEKFPLVQIIHQNLHAKIKASRQNEFRLKSIRYLC